MGIKKAIKKQDLSLLEEAVNKALEIYEAKQPEEPKVETVFGCLPLSAIWDEDTVWTVVAEEYSYILSKVAELDETLDRKVEIAKLVATSPVFRNINSSTKDESGIL